DQGSKKGNRNCVKIKLEVFEGPLDLLLYLIKKEEIDVYDIPIARITEQYLEYLEFMKLLDLNIAGEFILMAATLMHIKSKMLLPPDPNEVKEEEELDPRLELVQKLLEYKKFKEAAGELFNMERRQKDVFGRAIPFDAPPDSKPCFEASLFDLITAFNKILKDIPKDVFYEVIKDEFTVEGKMHDIFHMLVNRSIVHFSELFKGAKNKFEVVTIFLAVLELIRLKEIVAVQEKPFDEIKIERNPENIKPILHPSGAA
ncbi:MAG: segregation/condensation protein A, partial [Candidatus Omnitrophica bacterium]|nr:segregation/condensation protein A [Candidatus Omnitrophota bacterium]